MILASQPVSSPGHEITLRPDAALAPWLSSGYLKCMDSTNLDDPMARLDALLAQEMQGSSRASRRRDSGAP